MARVLLQRASSGFRTVRGELVKKIQWSLKVKGFDPGPIDGVFGDNTERAIRDYQEQSNLPITGKVDEDIWKKLVDNQLPSIRDRCLQITGDFEGHGFSKVVGNFDGAGMTWGIIGFTLRNGEFEHLLKEISLKHPNLLRQAFGNLTDELLQILDASNAEQMRWANRISIGSARYRVQREWKEAFANLGSYPEIQGIQLERVQKYWDIAIQDAKRFSLKTEMGLSLCFDIAVQCGGIDDLEEEPRIRKKIQANSPTTERDLRIIIANAVAENSLSQWVETVRSRKLTLATGQGEVNQSRYDIRTWGIDEYMV